MNGSFSKEEHRVCVLGRWIKRSKESGGCDQGQKHGEFQLAGIISFKMLPADRSKRYFIKNGKGGISCKLVGAIEMALLFALFEL